MPTIKQVENVLDEIASDPNNPKNGIVLKKLGLPSSAIPAWKESRLKPDDEKSVQVKNKIFDTITSTMPVSDKTNKIDFSDRFVVKNLIDRDPILQQKYLEKKGYQVQHSQEGLKIRKPGELQWGVVDPADFDRFDILDLVTDAGEALATTGGAALGAIGGLPGAITGGVVSAGAYEEGKQALAKGLGLRDDLDRSRINQTAIIGGLSVLGGKAVEKGFKWVSPKLKLNAKEIQEAAKELGVKVTPGQIYDDKLIQNLEAQITKTPGTVGGFWTRIKNDRAREASKEIAEFITKDKSGKTIFQSGSNAGEKLLQETNEKILPAAQVYEKYEALYSSKEFKPILETMIAKLNKKYDKVIERITNPQTATILRNIQKKELSKVQNLSQLKEVRTRIGKTWQSMDDFNGQDALKELYSEVTELRSKALIEAGKKFETPEIAEIAVSEIKQADKIYRQVAKDLGSSLFKGKTTKGGLKTSVKNYLEKNIEIDRIDKILSLNDPKKIEAIKNIFPETYTELREGAINQLARQAEFQGNLSPKRLVNAIDALPDETSRILFGFDATKKSKALKKYLENIPYDINPSGTELSITLKNLINPLEQAKSLYNSLIYNVAANAGKYKPAVGTGLLEFGTRAKVPTEQEFNFGIKQKELNFGLPSK
jgi:hypothetical protein